MTHGFLRHALLLYRYLFISKLQKHALLLCNLLGQFNILLCRPMLMLVGHQEELIDVLLDGCRKLQAFLVYGLDGSQVALRIRRGNVGKKLASLSIL